MIQLFFKCLFQLSLIVLILISCKKGQDINTKTIQIQFKKEGQLRFFKANTDSLIATFSIEIAENEYETQTGLMNRYEMKPDRGMLFIFPNIQQRSFYMKDTYIALDIIFLDDSKRIVSVQKNAQPLNENSLSSGKPAKYVVEIKANRYDQLQLSIGDRMDFTRIE